MLLLAGCAGSDSEPLPGTLLPPPLTVAHSPMTPGQNTKLVAAGAAPGELVRFAGSAAGVGIGPCPPALGGACLGVRDPAFLLGTAVADADGRATLNLRVPLSVGGVSVSLQAAILGGTAVLSTPITAPVSGSCPSGQQPDCNGLCFASSRRGNGVCDDGEAFAYGAPDFDCPALGSDLGDCAAGPLEVCYLGANRAGTTCVDVVDYSASWGPDYSYPPPVSAQYAAPVRYIDLDVADPGLAIAPNFVLDEFLQAWKGRYGVLAPEAVERAQAVRDAIGGALLVTSGYRNPGYNAGVGGVTNSRHMYGDAMDVFTSAVSLATLQSRCQAQGASFTQLYTGHVHCDWRNVTLEPVLFDPGFTGQAPPPPLEAADTLPEMSAELVPGVVWSAPAEGWDEGEPLREWTAYAADGVVIDEVVADTYTPPPRAAKVSVWVGREVWLERPVD